jgi:hypothetical protein
MRTIDARYHRLTASTAALLALLVITGCGDASGPEDAVAPDTAGAAIADRRQWCDVIADVDERFATLDTSGQSFALRQGGYEEIGRLLVRLDASASDVVDPSAVADVRHMLDFAGAITDVFVAAEDEEAAGIALFEDEDSPFRDEPDEAGAAWVLEHCGVDVDGDDPAVTSN